MTDYDIASCLSLELVKERVCSSSPLNLSSSLIFIISEFAGGSTFLFDEVLPLRHRNGTLRAEAYVGVVGQEVLYLHVTNSILACLGGWGTEFCRHRWTPIG